MFWSKFVSTTVTHHELDSNKASCSSHCCFTVTIERQFLKDRLLLISISRTSLSLLFSPWYWSSLCSCSFTHSYKFPMPHPRGSFAQSQPVLLSFWQLLGKGAMGNLHSLLNPCCNYLSWWFVLAGNSLQDLKFCKNGDT